MKISTMMIYNEALRLRLIGKWRKWLTFGYKLTRRQKTVALYSLIMRMSEGA